MEVMDLARVMYTARIKEAWGPCWINRPQFPTTPKELRAYVHNPDAEMDLAIVMAKAAISYLAQP